MIRCDNCRINSTTTAYVNKLKHSQIVFLLHARTFKAKMLLLIERFVRTCVKKIIIQMRFRTQLIITLLFTTLYLTFNIHQLKQKFLMKLISQIRLTAM